MHASLDLRAILRPPRLPGGPPGATHGIDARRGPFSRPCLPSAGAGASMAHRQRKGTAVPLQRLRTDFQFAIFVLFSLVAMLAIAPFAAYRFAHGELVAGIVDTSIVAVLAAALAYVWRGGNLERASLLVVATTTLGCVLVGRLVGLPGALWSYPAILANFLLIRRGHALAASAVVATLLVLDGSAFATPLDRIMYASAAGVTCLFAYVFARQTNAQRIQLEALAARDPLTGVANRRAMERELHIAAEAFRRHRVPVGVAVMDLDHFKRINDEAGHEAGDHVLVEFARVVQARCRSGDRLFRYGGEEFVLLLPGTDAQALASITDDLRREVARDLRAGERPVTVSIGAAVLEPAEPTQAWLARADAAMYEAKRLGRDRAVVAAPLPKPRPPAAA
jgi:diguanylate cyclase (GGDEF)-like protein